METTINQRIAAIIEYSGMTLTAFSKKVGIAQTSLRECVINKTEPKFSTLYKVIKAAPSISPSWLLTGEGDMILSKNDSDVVSKSNEIPLNDCIEATLQVKLKGNRNGNGFSLTFSGGTLEIEGR